MTASSGSYSIWRCAMWLALVSGLGQALAVVIARLATDRLIRISQDVVWTAPAANAVVFALAALILQLLTRHMQRPMAIRVALSVLLFLTLLGPVMLVSRLQAYAAIVFAGGVAVQTARMIVPRVDLLNSIIRRTLPGLIVLPLLLAAGLHISQYFAERRSHVSLPPAPLDAPNVILIVLDTVRAQNLSLYGYERQTSPHLDRFAKSAVVFDRAFSSSPWTLPSHASFFTGRLPHELTTNWLTPLDRTHPTLAEAFASRGYVTAAFVANLLYCTRETGLDRGFVHYSDVPLSAGMLVRDSYLARSLIRPLTGLVDEVDLLARKRASDVNEEFIAWIASRPQTPFLAFLNYFDAHAPYLAPPPFDTKFGAGGPQADIMRRRSWSPEEIQRSKNAYDGTLAYMDEQFGALLDALQTQRLLDNTIVVVTSDHGEQFGEHRLFDHANSLYRALLHVPLLIRFPSRTPAGVRVSDPVSLVNLPATILDLANSAGKEIQLPGRSLAESWRKSPASEELPEPVFGEVRRGINLAEWLPVSKGPMQSVIIDGMHYIRNGDGREELYDFEHDIAEVNDLASHTESHAALEKARRAIDRLRDTRGSTARLSVK